VIPNKSEKRISGKAASGEGKSQGNKKDSQWQKNMIYSSLY
jgi:hypothetical protein